jgi:hypothetical protein
MTSDGIALAAIVILLFPMGYFFLAAPAFLLVKLDIPQVTQLLRGMFNAHFLMTGIAGGIGTVTFALTGRPVFAIGVALIAAFAGVGARLVSATVGCPAQRQGCRRRRRGAPAAAAAFGRHAVQRDPAFRDRRQHSLCQRDGDLIRFAVGTEADVSICRD